MTNPILLPPIILDVEQGTQQWKEARAGFVTASRLHDVLDIIKRGEGAERRKYRGEIVCEILSGQPYPQHITQEMRWGTEHEPEARGVYGLENDVIVDRVGFAIHPEIGRFGCSPDGFVGDRGMLQIKCPSTRTHLTWIREGRIPLEHASQLIGELSCNRDRDWIDFMSYDPRLPDPFRTFVRRFERAGRENLILGIESVVEQFNAEIDAEIEQLRKGIA